MAGVLARSPNPDVGSAGALPLVPDPLAYHACPRCGGELHVDGWHIVGMRNLADLTCPKCGCRCIGDLPAGHGLYVPSLLELPSGVVHALYGGDWFAEWLARGFQARSSRSLPIAVDGKAEGREVVVLNCLDVLYGHALLKVLNAQAYLDGIDPKPKPLLLLIQSSLRWLVPDGVAEVWSVDLPLRDGLEWNDWFDERIHERLASFDRVWLAHAYAHPHPTRFSIDRFTRIVPFPTDEWEERARLAQVVTFIWREDRIWSLTEPEVPRPLSGIRHRLRRLAPLAGVMAQRRRVIRLAERLRTDLDRLDFAVVGLGTTGAFPRWIRDMRLTRLDAGDERRWCERYAASHVVVGVHGSNMLLPSAHAAAAVDLMPADRWTNVVEDLLPRGSDVRESLFAYRMLPVSTVVDEVAEVVRSLFAHRAAFVIGMRPQFSDPWSPVSPTVFLDARRKQ
jgi:hypothetical protein